MTRAPLTLALVLFAAPAARADMGPMIPFAKNSQTNTIRIEITDALPDHVGVFVKQYSYPKFETEAAFVALTPGVVLEFSGRYHDHADLFIVPRADAARFTDAKALAEAASAGRVPAVERGFRSRVAVPEWGPRDLAQTYRVRATASGPEIVRTSGNPLWQWFAAVFLVTAATLAGGFWLARRVLRRLRRTPAV